jgi:carbon-monoxide dehydrogenase iron sulfur subunit
MRRIYAREDYCIGCRLCEVYCLTQHSKSKNIIKAYREEPQTVPRLFVEESGHVSFAIQCRHCDDAPCLDACITGAMRRDAKTEAILCDEEKCVGCWMCVMVCPYGVISRNVSEKKVASKCDLCDGEETPVCVKNCPNEALVYEERKEK